MTGTRKTIANLTTERNLYEVNHGCYDTEITAHTLSLQLLSYQISHKYYLVGMAELGTKIGAETRPKLLLST